MTLEIGLLVIIAWGYIGHQTRDFVYSRFGQGWRELVSYTTGVTLVFPAFLFIAWKLFDAGFFETSGKTEEEIKEMRVEALRKVGLAYSLAYIPFGVGTFLGWVADGESN